MKNPVLMIKSIQIAVDHEKDRGMNSTLVAKFAQEKYIEISDSPNTSVTET